MGRWAQAARRGREQDAQAGTPPTIQLFTREFENVLCAWTIGQPGWSTRIQAEVFHAEENTTEEVLEAPNVTSHEPWFNGLECDGARVRARHEQGRVHTAWTGWTVMTDL